MALFRYQLICPALDPDLSTKARGRVVRAIAARTHAGPFGGQHRYSRDTLDCWLCAARRLCAVRRSELKEVEDLLVGLSQQPDRS